MGTAKTEKEELKAVVRERRVGKGAKAPLEEGLIRIGLPCSWKGVTSAYMEVRGGEHRNSVIFGRECLHINGSMVRILGTGNRKDECGQKSAVITILNRETNNMEQEVEILACEEALVSIGGSKCLVALSGPCREADPDADTTPRFEIPAGAGEAAEREGMLRFDTLKRGETLEIVGNRLLRFVGGGPNNRFLEIRSREGKTEAEFNGKDGDRFEIKLKGIEETLVLKLPREICAQNSVEILMYPKSWENKKDNGESGKKE